jgi:hypothetical protein
MSATATTDNLDWLWSGLDKDVTSKLTEEQKTAIARAVRTETSKSIPVDIRLSFGKFFVAFMMGRERRSKTRLKEDRGERPVFTVTNVPAIIFIWIAMIYITLTILSAISYLVFGLLS